MQILDRCRDPYGPLSDSRKALLAQLLSNPQPALWSHARGLIIRAVPVVTLETAVKAVTGGAVTAAVPDAFTLHRAVRFAVD